MTFEKHGQRHDAPLGADEIEFRAPTLATTPGRVRTQNAIATLKQVATDEKALAAEIAAKSAVLAKARAEASEIQQQLDDMLASRDSLAAMLKKGEGEAGYHAARVCQIEQDFDANPFTTSFAEAITEHANRGFMLSRFEVILPQWRTRLAELDKAILDFKAVHNVGLGA